MPAPQFDTPEKIKETFKAEIAQFEKDCAMQEADGRTEAAAKTKAIVVRLKNQYLKKYGEDV